MYIPAFNLIKNTAPKASFTNLLWQFVNILWQFTWAVLQLAFYSITLIPLLLVHLMQMFLESRFFARLAQKYFKLSMLASAGIIFLKTTRFGYFKFTGQEQKAAKEKEEALSWAQTAFEFCKTNAIKFVKQAAIGMVVGTLSLTTFVMGNIAYAAVCLYFWPDTQFDDYDADDDADLDVPDESFMDVVIFAPILEEIVYRGMVLPLMKKAIHYIVDYFKAKEQVVEHDVEATIPTVTTKEEAEQATQAEEPNTLIDHAANVGTAVLFAAAHSKERQPYAFLGGLVNGELTRRYGIVASMAEHMTNNSIAYAATTLKF